MSVSVRLASSPPAQNIGPTVVFAFNCYHLWPLISSTLFLKTSMLRRTEADTCDRGDDGPLQEAMSHRATEGVHAASDGAISHMKKRQSDVAHGGASPKKGKVEAAFRQADGVDGKLYCIFIEGECIPLWPQYLHKTAAGT